MDERVLNAGTTQRFVLLLVLFIAVTAGAAYDLVSWAAQSTQVVTVGSYLLTGVVIAAAIVLYRRLPRWKARPSRVVPLESFADGGGLQRALDDLVTVAGLDHRPRFVVDTTAASASAVVFGTRRAPVVRLNAGLVVSRRTEPHRFRAVVLHEFAHIHNRDVGITYATVAMWRILLAAVLIPEAVLLAVVHLGGVRIVRVDALVQTALIVAMVYLTRADILRTREIYADRTAVRLWGVRPEALVSGLHKHNPTRTGLLPFGSAVAAAWRSHPSWRLREWSLTRPDELFAMRGTSMFVTGMAAAIAAAELTSSFGSIGDWPAMAQYLLIAGVVVGVGGVALWRAIVHAVLTARPVPSGWRAGLQLGLGLVLGELTTGTIDTARPISGYATLLLLLVCVVGLLMAWTAQYAELRVRTYRQEWLDVAMVGGLITCWLVLAYLLLWWNAGTLWQLSVAELLAHADLPATDAPALLRAAAVLTALPGSDPGLAGLWWTVPLLWLIPLQLWIARLPRGVPRWLALTGRSLRVLADRVPFLVPFLVPVLVLAGLLGVPFLALIGFSEGPGGTFLITLALWVLGLVLARKIRKSKQGTGQQATYWLDKAMPGSAPPIVDAPELRRVLRIGLMVGLVACLGLLAGPRAAGAARDAHGWQVDSLVNLAWIVLVISAAMLVAAAVTAVTVKGRYALITALIAAGFTAVVGLVAQYAKSTVDGCLGPFNSMTDDCGWEPIRYLPFVEYASGFVLGPAALLAAMVAVLARAAARLFEGRADVSGWGAREARELARPIISAGVLNTVAVCLTVSVTLHQTVVMEAPLERRNLLFAYAVSPDGYIRTGVSPLAEWVRFAGDTLTGYAEALDGLARTEAALVGDVERDIATIAALATPACAALEDIAANAQADARLRDPDPPLDGDRIWTAYLVRVKKTAAGCNALLRARTQKEILIGFEVILADAEAAWKDGKALVNWTATKAGREPPF